MIVFEDRNRVGHDAAEEVFSKLVTSTPPATSIDRASYLYGMQTFCRRQLKRELSSAMDALENGASVSESSRFERAWSRPAQPAI